MSGDATLFARRDEVEEAWDFIDKIEHAWHQNPTPPRSRGVCLRFVGASRGGSIARAGRPLLAPLLGITE
jgi:hypothetical protein